MHGIHKYIFFAKITTNMFLILPYSIFKSKSIDVYMNADILHALIQRVFFKNIINNSKIRAVELTNQSIKANEKPGFIVSTLSQ